MNALHLVSLVCGGIGGAGLAAAFLLGRSPDAPILAPVDPAVRESLARLESDVGEVKARLRDVVRPPVDSAASTKPPEQEPRPEETAPPPSEPPAAASSKPSPASLEDEIAALVRDGLDAGALERFLRQIRERRIPGDLVDAAKALVEKDPTNPKAHYFLAKAYVEKLMTRSSVADMETLGELSMKEYDRALELDPSYWEPRFDKAESLSYYPETMGKASESIREFETLIRQQGRSTSNPRYAQSYVYLARLYTRVGKHEKAATVAGDGLGLFPDNSDLRQILELIRNE